MKKVLCVGNISYDTTVLVDEYPSENVKYRVTEKCECGGGQAATAAYLLGKWNVPVSFAGSVGTDLYSQRVIWELKNNNVDTNFCKMIKDKEVCKTFIIVNKQNGTRTTFSYTDEEVKLDECNIDFEPELILIDGEEFEIAKMLLEKYPKAISVLDAGRYSPEIEELATLSTFVICSKDFAEAYSKVKINNDDENKSLTKAYKKLNNSFKGSIIITLEDKGCAYAMGNAIKVMPSLEVDAVDTTGAGDVFHGAFVYGIYNEFDMEKTIKIANIASSLSITQLGSRNSVFPLEKVLELYEKSNAE